uniref:60S ribosomal protein L36a n=1 Tax=Denticeps clupeoides TaxID=299321 RepID=A0AAY4DLE5_9TELE
MRAPGGWRAAGVFIRKGFRGQLPLRRRIGSANMVNVPKTRRTYCKKCKKHQPHKVTQYKKGKDSLYAQGKRRYDRKQSGYGGQTKPIFRKKAKTTKKIVLRLECVEPNCRSKRMLAIKRCKHFELGGDKKRKVRTRLYLDVVEDGLTLIFFLLFFFRARSSSSELDLGKMFTSVFNKVLKMKCSVCFFYSSLWKIEHLYKIIVFDLKKKKKKKCKRLLVQIAAFSARSSVFLQGGQRDERGPGRVDLQQQLAEQVLDAQLPVLGQDLGDVAPRVAVAGAGQGGQDQREEPGTPDLLSVQHRQGQPVPGQGSLPQLEAGCLTRETKIAQKRLESGCLHCKIYLVPLHALWIVPACIAWPVQ